MKPKNLYLILAILGAFLPYSQFIPFLIANGFDVNLIWEQMFANLISSFVAWDLLIAGVALLVFIVHEGWRDNLRFLWLPILGTILIGVSFGLPLFLYLREIELAKRDRIYLG